VASVVSWARATPARSRKIRAILILKMSKQK
jgi:hypothetical protein